MPGSVKPLIVAAAVGLLAASFDPVAAAPRSKYSNGPSSAPASFEQTITILHYNDLEGHILPSTAADGDCSSSDMSGGRCYGGIARLAAMIQRERASAPQASEDPRSTIERGPAHPWLAPVERMRP